MPQEKSMYQAIKKSKQHVPEVGDGFFELSQPSPVYQWIQPQCGTQAVTYNIHYAEMQLTIDQKASFPATAKTPEI